MAVLPDLLIPGLNVVFCGTAPSLISAKKEAYYAKPGNKFWPTLYTIGLTPHQLKPHEFPILLNYGIGLTDLVKDQFGQDSGLKFLKGNRSSLEEKILGFAPKIVAFTSLRAAKEFLDCSVKYGVQRDCIGNTVVFVLPSPSGLAGRFWDITWWRELARLVSEP